MLKPQDIVILLKILSIMQIPKRLSKALLSQNQLAVHLCMSVSEVNAAFKRLTISGLLGPVYGEKSDSRIQLLPIKASCEECLVSAVKYFCPAEVGSYTTGIPTSYAAPVFARQIVIGNEPIPVWPHGGGSQRGLALTPLYSSVPHSIIQYPDPIFYDMLALIDAIRCGKAREREIAIKILRSTLNGDEVKGKH